MQFDIFNLTFSFAPTSLDVVSLRVCEGCVCVCGLCCCRCTLSEVTAPCHNIKCEYISLAYNFYRAQTRSYKSS